jgi:hypothetical protein
MPPFDGDQHLNNHAGRGVEQGRARVDRTEPRAPSAHRGSHGGRRAGDRAYVSMETRP